MRILADTNVLIRLTQRSHASHSAADAAVFALRARGEQLCIIPQIVYEYWAVATRPLESNGLDMGIEEARSRVRELLLLFQLLRDERAVYDRWEGLVNKHDVRGKSTHDARIVAAMLRHELTHLLTFDGDFHRFNEITVLSPGEQT